MSCKPTAEECAQFVLDLAALKARLLALAGGGNVESIAHADKRLQYTAGDASALERLIRPLQAKVDRCNGCRSRYRFVRFSASDGWRG